MKRWRQLKPDVGDPLHGIVGPTIGLAMHEPTTNPQTPHQVQSMLLTWKLFAFK